jgi:hypothetical protein
VNKIREIPAVYWRISPLRHTSFLSMHPLAASFRTGNEYMLHSTHVVWYSHCVPRKLTSLKASGLRHSEITWTTTKKRSGSRLYCFYYCIIKQKPIDQSTYVAKAVGCTHHNNTLLPYFLKSPTEIVDFRIRNSQALLADKTRGSG